MAAHAIDVTTASFERDVIEASRSRPVVVDFWAPWCGPCRVLKPVLEKLAQEYAGRFVLAKVNSDENQEVAAAFGVRSIPTVVGFRDGKPFSSFLGAVPEPEVRAFIEKLLPSPSEMERLRAAGLRESGDRDGAIATLEAALGLDTANEYARLDLAELLVEAGRLDEAARTLDAVRSHIDWDDRAATLRAALAFARSGSSGQDEASLRAALEKDPADHERRLALASMLAGGKRYTEALDSLLEIVRRDRHWNNDEARRQILNIFNLMGDQPEQVSEYRRRLASALY